VSTLNCITHIEGYLNDLPLQPSRRTDAVCDSCIPAAIRELCIRRFGHDRRERANLLLPPAAAVLSACTAVVREAQEPLRVLCGEQSV
jgi:hypothetical protein